MSRKHIWVLLPVLVATVVGCSGETVSPGIPTIAAPTSSRVSTTTASQTPPVVSTGQVSVAPSTGQTATSSTPIPIDCDVEHSVGTWTTEPQVLGTEPPDPGSYGQVSEVEVGQHECDDWFVVRMQIPQEVEVDVTVEYKDVITTDAEGKPIPLVGGAKLHVVIGMHGEDWAIAHNDESLLPTSGELAQWGAIRDVKFAGTFEGLTGFAIGVVDRNAVHVDSDYWGGMRRIVVRLAH